MRAVSFGWGKHPLKKQSPMYFTVKGKGKAVESSRGEREGKALRKRKGGPGRLGQFQALESVGRCDAGGEMLQQSRNLAVCWKPYAERALREKGTLTEVEAEIASWKHK